MSNEDSETEKLMAEFQDVAKQLEDVLNDLEWRKPDVEKEEAALKELEAAAVHDPGVDVASQRIVVRVLRGVLDDKIKEADALEARMTELAAEIEKHEASAGKPEEEEEEGEEPAS